LSYNRQLSVLFYCHGVGKITYACFFFNTVALTGVTEAEILVLRLRAVEKKLTAMQLSAESG
jgi:hypothetical protein